MIVAIILICLSLHISILVTNWALCTYERVPLSPKTPLVSVLIPARNEEANIKECLISALSQKYPHLEVITYDDCSNDRTYESMLEVKKQFPNLELIKATSLPDGWLGKSHGCHQLANAARGEILCFIDADVTLKPLALSRMVNLHTFFKGAAISLFPRQVCHSFGELILVPLMDFFVLIFFPMIIFRTSTRPQAVAATGQCFMMPKDKYFACGGHQRVRKEIVEDLALARNIIADGCPLVTRWGGNFVSCRMYSSFLSSLQGFQKSFYNAFGKSSWRYLIFSTYILFLLFTPLFLVCASVSIIPLILLLVLRALHILLFRYPLISFLFYPLTIIGFLFLFISSWWVTLYSANTWKGRKIPRGNSRQ